MGTRSLLAYEKPKQKLHVQYMQFDGSPACKGLEFYTGILKGVIELGPHALTKKTQRPNNFFFKRILNFLNEYQYASGHSVNNNFEIDRKDWSSQDVWQEWHYLFRRNGDLEIFNTYGETCPIYVIPWEITRAIMLNVSSFYELKEKVDREKSVLDDFFTTLEEWYSCHYDNQKDGKKFDGGPKLILETREVHAFPDQGEGGWRTGVLISTDFGVDNKELYKGIFWDRSGKKRNKTTVKSGVKGVR